MKDDYGDHISIEPRTAMPGVHISFACESDVIHMALSPEKARKFIRKIEKAINETEEI